MNEELERQTKRTLIYMGEICRQEGYRTISELKTAYNIEQLGC